MRLATFWQSSETKSPRHIRKRCSSPFMGRWRRSRRRGRLATLLTLEHAFDMVEVPPFHSLRLPPTRPQKDAGSRTRNSHQLDSGPFRQPGADEGGGAAAPAALVERDP